MDITIKRIYEEVSPDDGYRVLVDRLWPRGVTKDRARLNEWAKELAPSAQARIEFTATVQNLMRTLMRSVSCAALLPTPKKPRIRASPYCTQLKTSTVTTP